jgi:hypothetical protein
VAIVVKFVVLVKASRATTSGAQRPKANVVKVAIARGPRRNVRVKVEIVLLRSVRVKVGIVRVLKVGIVRVLKVNGAKVASVRRLKANGGKFHRID